MLNKQSFVKKFQPEANKIIEQYKIPGVGLGLQKGDDQPFYQHFGHRNAEEDLEVNGDTIFGIASMTKSFACVAIMQLQEAGKLSVNDPVIKHIPEFKTPNSSHTEKVEIHHLMTHTAGLPPLPTSLYTRKRSIEKDPSIKDYVLDLTRASGDPIDTPEELVEFLSELSYKPLGEPGREFSYSNDGYSLLGVIIKTVSCMSDESFVQKKIFQPWGMNNSTLYSDDFEHHENVTPLDAKNKQNEVYAAPMWWNVTASRAACALKSTVNDILTY